MSAWAKELYKQLLVQNTFSSSSSHAGNKDSVTRTRELSNEVLKSIAAYAIHAEQMFEDVCNESRERLRNRRKELGLPEVPKPY